MPLNLECRASAASTGDEKPCVSGGALAAWETVEFEYELVEAGDRVVILLDQVMRGRSTRIEVPMGRYAQAVTFRDGLIVHWKAYRTQAAALEAVGLRE
jgi:hypothetical protein